MQTNRWEHLKTSTSISINNRSQGMEPIESGSSQLASWIDGMEHVESRSSDQFASWIDGKGQFVPQPLAVDAVPQVVVVGDLCHGVTNEMLMDYEYLESCGTYPTPVIAPVIYLAAPYNNFPTQCHEMSAVPIVKQSSRYLDALSFRSFFINRSSTNGCNNSVEKGTCIWSNGTHSWSDKSCGVTWVAVHGINSICVVTRLEDLEREVTPRVRSIDRAKEDILHMFRQGIIYKVEDIANQMSVRPRQFSNQSFKKPFGVVSVISGTREGSGHQASSAEYDEEKAIKFLQDEMKSNTDFTVNKTVQAAIYALQHLFRQKFKANEIRVIVWKEDGDIVKELPSRDDRSIEEQIAVIRAR